MVLTNQELDKVLSFIRTEIVKIQQINSDITKATSSKVLQRDPNFNEDETRKDHAKNIAKAIRFITTEQGISQLPTAFTRAELETVNVLEKKENTN